MRQIKYELDFLKFSGLWKKFRKDVTALRTGGP